LTGFYHFYFFNHDFSPSSNAFLIVLFMHHLRTLMATHPARHLSPTSAWLDHPGSHHVRGSSRSPSLFRLALPVFLRTSVDDGDVEVSCRVGESQSRVSDYDRFMHGGYRAKHVVARNESISR
jgi:hypothetical protein